MTTHWHATTSVRGPVGPCCDEADLIAQLRAATDADAARHLADQLEASS